MAQQKKSLPCDLLILPLSWLNLQTALVHLMDITSGLHISQDIFLKLRDTLQAVRHVLVLLNVTDDLGSLCALGEIDELRFLDDGGNAVFDESKIRQIDTEEGDTWRVCFVQRIAILEEVLGRAH